MTDHLEPTEGGLVLDATVEGRIAVVRVAGEVDLASAARFQAYGEQLVDDGAQSLVVDCSQIGFMGSTGLRVLVALHQRVEAVGGTLTVQQPSAALHRILTITGLTDHFTVGDPVPAMDRVEDDEPPSA